MKSISLQLLMRSAILLTAWLTFFVPLKSHAENVSRSDQQKGKLAGFVRHIVEEEYTEENPKSRIVMTKTYDMKGNVLESEVALVNKDAPNKNAKQRTVFTRNLSGQIIEAKTYQDDGSLFLTEVSTHDIQGHLLEKVSHRPDGSVREKWAYVYDSNGNKAEERYYVGGALKARSVFDYDNRGNAIKTVSYKQDGSIEYSAVNKYDDRNHLTEIDVLGPTGSEERRRIYRYNAKGHLTEDFLYNANNSLEEKDVYVYEFDGVGNWVKQTMSKWVMRSGKLQQELAHIRLRTISYYPDENRSN